MFSKALFKQSCKANGIMWAIITFAVCFMLACVMMISGGGNIGQMKNAIQDTIIIGEIDAQTEYRSLNYYKLANDGLAKFDTLFTSNFVKASTYGATFDAWVNTKPTREESDTDETYAAKIQEWQQQMPQATENVEKLYQKNFNEWQQQMPVRDNFESDEEYNAALSVWNTKKPAGSQGAYAAAYMLSVNELQQYVLDKALAVNPEYTAESAGAQEMLGAVMYTLNPNGNFDEFYTAHGETVPESYDTTSLITNVSDDTYIASQTRTQYRTDRSKYCAPIFIAGNMTQESNIELMLAQLANYGVTKEKYDSFGYTYDSIKHSATTAVISYQTRFAYEYELLLQRKANGEFADDVAFNNAVATMDAELTGDLSSSLLSTLPKDVADALEEVGKMDMYGVIVGSIFFKMAGLLLPIIFMIMASNNLIAGQVDNGSMAYVLSTSTKRKQVVFTQAIYLVSSLFAMFCLTTVTSVICLALVENTNISLTYGKLILLNLGAFVTMFAMSGICFLTSCWFDRSKRSMSIGGGLSMFFLVATMLGLFGSPVIPSVIRLDALNNFNYVSIISLFDAVSILNGTTTFIWKLAILLVIGVVGYVIGSIKFKKKDLPL